MSRPRLPFEIASRRLRGKIRAEAMLARAIEAGQEDPERGEERLGKPTEPRPDGPLVWIHVGHESEAVGIPDLIDRLREERDDVEVLITTSEYDPEHPLHERLPSDVIVQYAPYDEGKAPTKFLAHWTPDFCIWSENRLNPLLLQETFQGEIETILIDARVPERPGIKWIPGLRRDLLRGFSHVLAGDNTAMTGLKALGVLDERIEQTGFLQESTAPLPCSQAERDMIAELLEARPVWAAMAVNQGELEMVSGAHQRAIRRSHRLLLVLVPEPLEAGPDVAKHLEAQGWQVGLRSADDEPEIEMEIYVADLPDEQGLWYRLAPVCFMGGTLAKGQLRSPFEAAALGSAVLYGPNLGAWRQSYERLRDAGAARTVSDTSSLAHAVEYLLAPDKAAEMAAAAWEVTTNGAQATDRVVELVLDGLDRKDL
ncbi:MAG: 3-deoxy-D-manno-octulosonic acid transferase [Maritimibacter sp.]